MTSVEQQLNIDMLQQPRWHPSANSRNYFPFSTNQVYGVNQFQTLMSTPTIKSIANNPLPASTVEQYNAANLDTRTLMNFAQPLYGQARNQLSLISDQNNLPQKLLPNTNKKVFADLKIQEKPVKVKQFKF